MKLVLAEPRFLRESISIISELVNEVNFKVDKEKIELIAMDPANVAMIIFKLLSSAFIEYTVDKPVEFAISLANLKQILRRVKPTDTLVLELDSQKNKLKIQLRGESNRTFHQSLIDVEEKEQKIPDLSFPVKIETSSLILDEAIEDVSIVAESVSLTVSSDKFVIDSESNLSTAKVEILKDEETSITTESSEEVTAKYSIEYLKKIIKGSKLADKVILSFNKDYPLKIEYNVLDKLSFSVILAPRVSND